MDRRIAAILAADMVGFSRLVELDEAAVIARQKQHMELLIRPAIEAVSGRVVKLTGDGLIAEFPSVVDAVRCAVGIQEAMPAREADQPTDQRVRYRIAVNLGDVIFDDGDGYGDGVNIAARLQALAKPGGVVVSGGAYDHLKTKAGVGFRPLSSQQWKNIATPVRVYQVVREGAKLPSAPARRRRTLAAAAVAAVLVVVGAGAALRWGSPDVTPADEDRMAYALSDKPSVAVLPFTNLNESDEPSILEDGLTMDLITELSRSSTFMVIAQHSMFEFKDQEVSPTEVAEALGVGYVVEGNVQEGADDLQINVHLIDSLTSNLVWAEKYRRPKADFFEIQDDMSSRIAAVMSAENGLVAQTELKRAKRRSAASLTAYELKLLANEAHHQYGKESNQKSLELLNQAIALDPSYSDSHSARAWTYYHEATNDWTTEREEAAQKALEDAQRAVLLDPGSALARYSLGGVELWLFDRTEEGIASFERALRLEPNNADLMAVWGGCVLPEQGRVDEGLKFVERAFRVNPYYPNWYNRAMQYVLFAKEDYAESAFYFESLDFPLGNSHMIYVAGLADAGKIEKARQEAARMLEMEPDFSIAAKAKSGHISASDEIAERVAEGMRLAGLPE